MPEDRDVNQVDARSAVIIRPTTTADRAWIQPALRAQWGSTSVIARGVVHQADELPGLVAEVDGQPAGLLTYDVAHGALEVVTLQAMLPRRGVGTALLAAAREVGRAVGCRRVWLITTNDNLLAQRFYERRGMRRVAVHVGAVNEARKLKPEIPLLGIGGCPIEDEIEYEHGL